MEILISWQLLMLWNAIPKYFPFPPGSSEARQPSNKSSSDKDAVEKRGSQRSKININLESEEKI